MKTKYVFAFLWLAASLYSGSVSWKFFQRGEDFASAGFLACLCAYTLYGGITLLRGKSPFGGDLPEFYV